MNFLYPQFLFALFTVLIPVIIHLFNFQRYRKVQFSNVALLKEIKHSTKAKSTLKHILILISRMLAIAAIVLAFAQPYIPVTENTHSSTAKSASIFLDNSFSMENHNVNGRIFGLAREYGHKIIEELPTHVNHQLLTNNFTGAEQHLYPTSELTKKMADAAIGSQTQSFSRIVKRQESAFEGESFTGYIISDFQKSQYDFENVVLDSLNQYFLIPIEPVVTNNVSVDSVWFLNPVHRINQPEEIHFRIRNYGNSDQKSVRTTLFLNEQQKSFSNISVPANSYIDTFIIYTNSNTGWHKGKIEVTDSPILFDNTLFFSFNISKEIKVLEITSSESENYVSKAFELEPYFAFTTENQSNVDYSLLSQTDLLILNSVTKYSTGMISSIANYVSNGGNLIIFPSKENANTELNTLLNNLQVSKLGSLNTDSTRVKYLDFENEIYQDVFTEENPKVNLPDVYQHYATTGLNSGNKTALLQTINRQDILSKWNSSTGTLYLFTTPLQKEFTNLGRHSIFLPTLYQIAFQSANSTTPYSVIGTDDFVKIKATDNKTNALYHIKSADLRTDIIPEIYPENNSVRLGYHQSITQAGNYELTLNDSVLGYLAFNFKRTESSPASYSSTELEELVDSLGLTNFTIFNESLDQFSSEFKKLESGIELWKWFVILALVFLAIEIVLIRFFKPSVI